MSVGQEEATIMDNRSGGSVTWMTMIMRKIATGEWQLVDKSDYLGGYKMVDEEKSPIRR